MTTLGMRFLTFRKLCVDDEAGGISRGRKRLLMLRPVLERMRRGGGRDGWKCGLL